jgi:hypothetical protein
MFDERLMIDSISGTAGSGSTRCSCSQNARVRAPVASRMLPTPRVRGQAARQLVEAQLLLRPRQELDQLPRRITVRRVAEHDQAGAAGQRDAARRPVGPGIGAVAHEVLQLRRQPRAELAQVPRPRDPHREEAAAELLVGIRHIVVAERRRQALAEQARGRTRTLRGTPAR